MGPPGLLPPDPAWSQRRAPSPPRPGEVRSPWERDRARVIHSAAFRRLQAKTQVLGIGDGDFHRTRLTHSMEAAQIIGGVRKVILARYPRWAGWLADPNLAETLALAHDLGHPPFGHEGEAALNYAVLRATQGKRGFEANGQTLRLLARLEAHTPGYGLNLTRRALLGVLKYPVPYGKLARPWPPWEPKPLNFAAWHPPKAYHEEEEDVVEWVLAPLTQEERDFLTAWEPPQEGRHGTARAKSLDTSLLDLADDIAYGTHDLEDGVALGLIGPGDVQEDPTLAELVRTPWGRRHRLEKALRDLFTPWGRKAAMGALVHALVTAVRLREVAPGLTPLVGLRAELLPEGERLLATLKDVVRRRMMDIPQVRTIRFRAQQAVVSLYEAFLSDPGHLLPRDFAVRATGGEEEPARVVADYLSGMTDAYAARMYARLYLPTAETPPFERM